MNGKCSFLLRPLSRISEAGEKTWPFSIYLPLQVIQVSIFTHGFCNDVVSARVFLLVSFSFISTFLGFSQPVSYTSIMQRSGGLSDQRFVLEIRLHGG